MIPNLASRLSLIDENEKGSIQQAKLADVPLTFLVAEETSKAFGDDLGKPPRWASFAGTSAFSRHWRRQEKAEVKRKN